MIARSKIIGAVFVLLLIVIAGVFANINQQQKQKNENQSVSTGLSKVKIITPAQLNKADPKALFLINVHIPYAGQIKATDAFIPYNEIEKNQAKLPSDKSARIVVYCRSGRMSVTAARTLVGLGYTNVSDLEGGMDNWKQQGFALENG